MTKPAAKPVAQKFDPARAASWGDYDPHFSSRKAAAGIQGTLTAPALDRSNSPYFRKL